MPKTDKKRSATELEDSKTPDAHKRRAQSHVQTPADPDKKEGYSSDSSAAGVAHCEITDLVLSVREDLDNSLRIFVSNSRPDILISVLNKEIMFLHLLASFRCWQLLLKMRILKKFLTDCVNKFCVFAFSITQFS